MIEVVTGDNPLDAWQQVARKIYDEGDQYGLMVEIVNTQPSLTPELLRKDPSLFSDAKSMSDVANTIFPKPGSWWEKSENEFFTHYTTVYSRRKPHGTWGTYYQRLTAFGQKNSNQLRNAINCLNSWGVNHRATFTLHLSSPDTDSYQPLGAPCWQYGEFLQEVRGTLSLLATYRSHDYYSKALGNFIGLSRVLNYVCQKTGKEPGRLVCNSARAFSSRSKRKLNELLEV